MRVAVLGAAAVLVAAAAVLAGGDGAAEDKLGVTLDGVSEGGHQEPGQTFVIGSIPLCRDGIGTSPITIDAVRSLDGDLRVTGFAVRDNPFETDGFMIGNANGSLAANGLHRDPDLQITERCDAPESSHQFGYELVVELRADDRDTSTTGFAIDYHGVHNAGTLEDRLGVYSCVDHTIALCEPDASPSPG